MVLDPDELQALVEALIEEARQRARRRRRRRGAFVALAVLAGGSLYFSLSRDGGSTPSAARDPSGGAAVAVQTGERWGPSRGPDGGPVYAVAVAPSTPQDVYLATSRGVFRSTNGGRSWTSAKPLSASQSWFTGATSVAVDPRTPTTVYAGRNWRWSGGTSYGQTVLKSIDGGRSWRALAVRGQPVAVTPTTVYAATGGPRKTSRLVKSTDGGRNWQPADAGLPPTYLWGLAFAPSSPATVYAAMGKHGVFASSDGGSHWHAVGNSARNGETTAIAVDPLHARTVYAATNAGIVASYDGGRSWHVLNATIRRHEHGLEHWDEQVTALLVDPRSSRTLYASTRCAGVFKTTDGGGRWSPANTGLKPGCPWAYSLALDPQAPRTIYAADPTRGLFKSVDGGTRWLVRNDGLSLAWISSVAVDPRSPETVYAATGPLGLFKTADGGTHWQSLSTGLESVYGVAVDPSDHRHVLISGYDPRDRSPGSNTVIAESTDAGRTWSEAGLGGRGVSAIAIRGQTAFAGTYNGDGVFGSVDGGRSWRALGPPGAVYVQALAVASNDSSVVYAGATGKSRGVYKSTDGGHSWRRLAPDVDVNAIVLDSGDPSTVYVATIGGEGAIFESTDGGATWQPENSGLRWRVKARNGKWVTQTLAVTALAVDPAHPSTLYAATDERGVFRSTDAGGTWHPFNEGLAHHTVTAFAVGATGQIVYAGTQDGGVVSLRRTQ
jgi:photosystem II stability/assembly factor-like uncharacterized protein